MTPAYDGPGPYDEDDSYDGSSTGGPSATPEVLYPSLLELAFGADPAADPSSWTWTHVADDDFEDQTVSIRRGRADESSEVAPSSASFRLGNRHGNYTPTDPRSDYYPNVRRGTPVRFWVKLDDVWRVRFVGQVSEWSPEWPEGDLSDHDDPAQPGEAYVTIVCNGILRRLGQGVNPLRSPMSRLVPPTAVGFWPLEDGRLTDRPTQLLGGPASVTGAIEWVEDTLPGSGPLPTIVDGATGAVVVHFPSVTQAGWTVSIVFRATPASLASVLRVRSTKANILVRVSKTQLEVTGTVETNAAPETINSTVDLTDVIAGRWMRLSLSIQRTPLIITSVDWSAHIVPAGETIAEAVGSASGTVGSAVIDPGNLTAAIVRRTAASPNASLVFGHILGTTGTHDFDPSADYGWAGECADTRMVRLCTEEGIALDLQDAEGGCTPMGPQKLATLPELLNACTASESGLLGEQLDRPGLTFRTRAARYNQTPTLVLDASSNEIDAPFAPTLDDQRLRNDVTVTRDDGASARVADDDSIDDEGRYDETVTVSLASDTQTRHHASWRLHLGTWGEMRYPSLSASLDTAPTEILDVQLGDRLQVTDLPPQHPEGGVDAVVEGWTETISNVDYRIELNCSPAGPWNVWKVGDPVGSAPLAL